MRSFLENQKTDLIQKAAWRLVRSAYDRMGENRGADKRTWCVDRMAESFPKMKRTHLEDHVRAAYVVFKTEKTAVNL